MEEILKKTKLSYSRQIKRLRKSIKIQYKKTKNVWNNVEKRSLETQKLAKLRSELEMVESERDLKIQELKEYEN